MIKNCSLVAFVNNRQRNCIKPPCEVLFTGIATLSVHFHVKIDLPFCAVTGTKYER